MIYLKVVSNYDTDENMYKTMNNCFVNNTSISLTKEDNYDYLLVINGYNGNIKTTRDKVFGLLQEPIGNINYDRNLHFYCSKIFCQSPTLFNSYKGIIKTPIHMFYSHHVELGCEYFKNFDDIKNRKKLCLIVSALNSPNNPKWQNHNYSKRHMLVSKLLESDLDFDFYGRGWNIKDHRYKGECSNKHETLRKYEFSIAIENTCEENYASEKIFDCFLNNTVPIYYGCPNVSDLYDRGSYELLNFDLDLVDQVRNIIKKTNETYKNFLHNSKNIYFEKYNIFNLIENNLNE